MVRLLERLGLDVRWPPLAPAEVGRWLAADKKSDGQAVRFVAAGAPGALEVVAIPRAEVLGWVSSFEHL
jgi:3-dehydroquinate synthetase